MIHLVIWHCIIISYLLPRLYILKGHIASDDSLAINSAVWIARMVEKAGCSFKFYPSIETYLTSVSIIWDIHSFNLGLEDEFSFLKIFESVNSYSSFSSLSDLPSLHNNKNVSLVWVYTGIKNRLHICIIFSFFPLALCWMAFFNLVSSLRLLNLALKYYRSKNLCSEWVVCHWCSDFLLVELEVFCCLILYFIAF